MRVQSDLIEDLVHAHAHTNDRLRILSHEAAQEILRLNRVIREMQLERKKSFWNRLVDRFNP
jgi:hypothetical protein